MTPEDRTLEGYRQALDRETHKLHVEIERLIETLDRTRRTLLEVEGALLAYWTDIPQAEIQRLLPLIRETLGDYEPQKG